MERITYQEGNSLTAADLNAGQAHRLEMRRRHNLGGHDWGILFGLDIFKDGQSRQYFLQKGAAVDGYGRELYVSEALPIFKDTAEEGSDLRAVDLWLQYARREDSSRDGLVSCTPREHTRWLEEARLCITRSPLDDKGAPLGIDPRLPNGVPPDDLNFPPFQSPPDDPARPWPVYVGRLTRNEKNNAWSVDDKVQLPFAILVGSQVRSASRQPVPEEQQKQSKTPLAPLETTLVELAPAGSRRPPFGIRVIDAQGRYAEPLSVSDTGNLHLQGRWVLTSLPRTENVTLQIGGDPATFTEDMIGDPERLRDLLAAGQLPLDAKTQEKVDQLTKPGGQAKAMRRKLARILNKLAEQEIQVDPARLKHLGLSQPIRTQNRPGLRGETLRLWNARMIAGLCSEALQNTDAIGPGRTLEIGPLGVTKTKTARPWQLYRLEQDDGGNPAPSRLRFEILDPGETDDQARHAFVIGSGGTDKGFMPCLSVDPVGNVTIEGDLVVEGNLVQGPVQADPADPRFLDQLVKGWSQATDTGDLINSSLFITITSINAMAGNREWSYKITIDNKSNQTIHNIEIYDTYSINGSLGKQLYYDEIQKLGPNASQELSVSHSDDLKSGQTISIAVSARGQFPNGMPALGTAQGEETVKYPPEV